MSTPRTRAVLWLVPLVTIAALFGGYGIASATGTWVTSGKTTVTAGTRLSPTDLKGWMTLQQAADGLGIDVALLIRLLEAPDGTTITGDTAFKDLEALIPGFDLTTFKARLSGVLQPEGTAPAPVRPATPDTTAPAASPSSPTQRPEQQGTPTPPRPSSTSSITGQSTLRQVAQANGLDPEALRAQAGLPVTVGLDVMLKDIRNSVPGFEIQSVRDAVDRMR